MALRALLFSKNPETAESLGAVLKQSGITFELCTDIFAAMEKGTKRPFSCVIVDWSEQPEAGFLLKRARESGLNRTATAIAIVDDDPSAEEEREHRLDFLIYRPIVVDEAAAVLAKASQSANSHSGDHAGAIVNQPEIAETSEPHSEDPNLVSIASELPDSPLETADDPTRDSEHTIGRHESRSRPPVSFQSYIAAALVLTAAFFFWKSWDAFRYLAKTPEGAAYVLTQSVTALFYLNSSGTQPVGTSIADSQQDAYFTRMPANANMPSSTLRVASADVGLPDGVMRLRPPFDFPLPVPEMHIDPAQPRRAHAAVPDSIKASAPVTRPVSLTVTPAQMMPVSTAPASTSWQQAGEPIHLTEESARALITQTVNPAYPPEALGQKLQGPVVLQLSVGRDGSVQDLKLVRGYFVLGRAAIAAVKQWRFKPYSVNGHALETQTVITINFTYPPG